MIAFIAYVAVVSVLLVAAAGASEPLLRAISQPTRSVWLAAVSSAVMIALMAIVAPPRNAPAPVLGAISNRGVVEPSREPGALLSRTKAGPLDAQPTNAIAPTTAGAPSTPVVTLVVAGCWLVGSLICFARLLAGARRVTRLRRSCRTGRLCDESVLISADVGPAVLGVLRHRIVVPSWVEELNADAQRMIVAHEREHVRARDPLALHVVLLLVALMPWNIAFWYALHRLRAAIEIDCDARVLRGQRPMTRDYCRLLLDVGARTVAEAPPLLALAEPATLLERRIESMMTTRTPRDWKILVAAAGAVLLLAGACRTPRPEIAPAQRFAAMTQALGSAMARGVGGTPSSVALAGIAMEHPTPAATTQPVVTSSPPSGFSSRPEPGPRTLTAFSTDAALEDTTVRNEEALRRSAAEHQAHIDALADSVIRTSYPELTRRPAGTPAFLALVLDDRERVMRHAISLDPGLPNDLAAIMLDLHIDTISGRTIGLGISDNNRWHVTVGHAVEALGPVRGHPEMRAWMTSPRPYALQRVPYERIVDSVARARSPEAYREHEGIIVIAMMLDEAGHVTKYGAEARADTAIGSVRGNEVMSRLIGDSARTGDIDGVMVRLIPSKTTIVWGVRR